jgi:hypothetical protein
MINCWRMGREATPTPPSASPSATRDRAAELHQLPQRHGRRAARGPAHEHRRRGAQGARRGHRPRVRRAGPQHLDGRHGGAHRTTPEVNGVVSWTLPDGTAGSGIPEAVTRWGQVWLGE